MLSRMASVMFSFSSELLAVTGRSAVIRRGEDFSSRAAPNRGAMPASGTEVVVVDVVVVSEGMQTVMLQHGSAGSGRLVHEAPSRGFWDAHLQRQTHTQTGVRLR